MHELNTPVYALILAGGAGTRFWPASRAARPKQLLPLVSAEPLLLATAARILPLCAEAQLVNMGRDAASAGPSANVGRDAASAGPSANVGRDAASGWGRVLVATGGHLSAAVQAILPELPARNLLVEPAARNTAPCIGWAAAVVARVDPSAVIAVLPSDHHIADVERFRAALRVALRSALGGTITTIGIRPTHPETGFGYIEAGDGQPDESGAALAVRRFVEKPDRERAAAFVASGRYLWNAGMFFFRAGDMLAAIRAHLPALADGLAELDRAAARGAEEQALASIFPSLPSVSIDHGVMEHLTDLAVVPGDFGWSDVGSWQSAWELADKDDRGNSAPPGAVLVDARRNHVVDLRRAAAEGATGERRRVIALIGVEDLIVVETDDALLIMPRDRAQDVKRVVDVLRARGDEGLV